MRMPRIHSATALDAVTQLNLPAATARRLHDVLRLTSGAALILFDGNGGEYAARLRSLDSAQAVVDIGDFHDIERESPLRTELGLALSLGRRFDYAIQKATELGVNLIAPLESERSELKLRDARRAAKRHEHWRKILTHACEQSGRTRLPTLLDAQPLERWLAAATGECKLALAPAAKSAQLPTSMNSASLLIGPEGGLSDEEMRSATRHGFVPLSLGPRILRAETAPLAALALLQRDFGDL